MLLSIISTCFFERNSYENYRDIGRVPGDVFRDDGIAGGVSGGNPRIIFLGILRKIHTEFKKKSKRFLVGS